jgi:hypothetical protein
MPVTGTWLRHIPAGSNPLYRPPTPADGRWQRGATIEGIYATGATAWTTDLILSPHSRERNPLSALLRSARSTPVRCSATRVLASLHIEMRRALGTLIASVIALSLVGVAAAAETVSVQRKLIARENPPRSQSDTVRGVASAGCKVPGRPCTSL